MATKPTKSRPDWKLRFLGGNLEKRFLVSTGFCASLGLHLIVMAKLSSFSWVQQRTELFCCLSEVWKALALEVGGTLADKATSWHDPKTILAFSRFWVNATRFWVNFGPCSLWCLRTWRVKTLDVCDAHYGSRRLRTIIECFVGAAKSKQDRKVIT